MRRIKRPLFGPKTITAMLNLDVPNFRLQIGAVSRILFVTAITGYNNIYFGFSKYIHQIEFYLKTTESRG